MEIVVRWGSLIMACVLLLPGNALALSLLFEDDFNDNTTDPAWVTNILGTGASVSEANQRLEVDIAADAAEPDGGDILWGLLGLGAFPLQSDFDASVDYELALWPSANGVRVGLGIFTFGSAVTGFVERVSFGINDHPTEPTESYVTDFSNVGESPILATADQSGSLRLVRSGNTLTGYALGNSGWIEIGSAPTATPTDPVYIILQVWSHDANFTDQNVRAAFDNFVLLPEPTSLVLLVPFLTLLGVRAIRH
jgi:hypothetical protein